MAGLLGKLSGRKDEHMEIEEYLEQLGLEEGDLLEEQADMWVISQTLEDLSDIDGILGELKKGNQVVLNIEPLKKKNKVKVRQAISELKGAVHDLNGDIVALNQEQVILTPSNVKVRRQ
ncbi:MAG: cell division protein SepF [DPANN group archaeon]|nr:cell division protein SepF [DPANN group archaeon]